MMEINAREQNKEKIIIQRNEDSLKDLWDNVKRTNIRIIGVPEKEEKRKEPEKILEDIIVKHFPNMGKVIVTKFRKCRVPYRINPRSNMPRHLLT